MATTGDALFLPPGHFDPNSNYVYGMIRFRAGKRILMDQGELIPQRSETSEPQTEFKHGESAALHLLANQVQGLQKNAKPGCEYSNSLQALLKIRVATIGQLASLTGKSVGTVREEVGALRSARLVKESISQLGRVLYTLQTDPS